jgi:hypothetical protein
LLDAAWAALITGHARELHHLQRLLEHPVDTATTDTQTGAEHLLRLQLLLAATARNLRLLRGQFRRDSF